MTQSLKSVVCAVRRTGPDWLSWTVPSPVLLGSASGIVVAALFTATMFAQQFPRKAYEVVELDTFGKRASVAVSVNNNGQSVGALVSLEDPDILAAVWDSRGKPQKVQTPAADPNSIALAINDGLDVVGTYNALESARGFLRTSNGEFHILPNLPGDNAAQAVAINNRGESVGFSTGARGMRACLWSRDRQPVNLGMLPGGTLSKAMDINSHGTVVGFSDTATGNRAFLWSPQAGMQDLGLLPTGTSSEAFAINDAGMVVGQSFGPSGMRAFVWTKQFGIRDLGVLPKGSYSRAVGINNRGEVIGMSSSDKGERAFVWNVRDGMTDLNEFVEGTLPLVEALAINDKGQILVSGRDSVSGHHSGLQGSTESDSHEDENPTQLYLLTPVAAGPKR